MREWLVIEPSWKNSPFADEAAVQKQTGYIPRDVAEKLLGRKFDDDRVTWFTREDSEKMRSHPEWRHELKEDWVTKSHHHSFATVAVEFDHEKNLVATDCMSFEFHESEFSAQAAMREALRSGDKMVAILKIEGVYKVKEIEVERVVNTELPT